MSARSSRSPFDDLDDDDADAGSEPEAVSDLSSDEYEDEPQSMTGKGIKRLCSELIELKSASEDDFLQNVYSNYQTFVRVFKDLGVVDSELMNLKQHITTQQRLVQVLENNISLDIESVDSVDSEVEEAEELDLPSPRARMNDVLEKLDVLLSERQVDEALLVLKLEGVNLRKMQMEDDYLSPYLATYASEMSDRRARLIRQLTLLADHPRVDPPELQKALSGLCNLGEDKRANFLLLKYYRSRLANRLHELRSSKHSLHGTYMMELAKVVFSVISQAARSFVLLYGEASPYTSDLIQWAREETEALSCDVCKFVKSISEMSGGLPLAVETVKAAISFCSLLNPQRIILQSNLTKLIRPCMEEALQMHVDQLRKVINIFATTDTWVLGKYFISGTSLASSSIGRIDGKMDHCLLSSSGRKFVTLMQAFVDDMSPLVVVQMECSILKGLADLFCGYIGALEKAVSERTNGAGNDFPRIGSALELLQQLSILVTSSAVVQLFPSIAGGIFNRIRTSNNELLLKHLGPSLEKELDIWMLSIEEASNKFRDYFCRQFVCAVMSDEEYGWRATLETYVDFQHKPSLPADLIPSFAFQAFFLRMRNLEKFLKPVPVDEYGILEKLSKELMKAMMIWLSNNLDFWKAAEHGSGQCSCFEQFHLDVDFLVEVARLGGYFSDDLLTAVMNLLAQAEDEFAECESDTKSGPADDASPDDDWSSNAAKLAIEKLLGFEMLKSERKEETGVSSEEDLTQNAVDVSPSEDNCGSMDGESADSAEEDITRIETTGRDHSGTVKLKEEAEDVEEQDADEILNISKHEPFGATESARGMLIDLTERLDQALKFDFLDVSADLDTIVSNGTTENTFVNSTTEMDEKVEQIVKLLLPASEEYEPVGRPDESFSIAIQPNKDVRLVKENSFGVGLNLELKSNILEVSDRSDEFRENTGTVETDEIKYTDKAGVSSFLIDLEEEFVGNFDASVDKIAAEPAREEPIGAQYLEMMFKLLEVSDNVDADLSHATEEKTGAVETSEIEYSKETYTRVFPEEIFIGELDEFAMGTAQSVRATAIALANIENLVSINKLAKETDHPDYYISDVNSSEKIHTVLTEDSSEPSSKGADFTDTLINKSTNRKALNKVEDIEKEKMLVGNGKEKINDESLEKQDKDDVGNIRASKAKLNEFSRAKRKRERPRSVINLEHLEKTKRGPATPRPRWT